MATDRRCLLKSGAASLVLGLCPQRLLGSQLGSATYASGIQFANGKFGVGFYKNGDAQFSIPLPARAHGIARHPDGSTVAVFARRPGEYIAIIDLHQQKLVKLLSHQNGFRFTGHGFFSSDGQFLFASSNHFTEQRGALTRISADGNYDKVRQLDAYGVGTHEILESPDGKSILIANGGIITHPDYGRTKLNLATMSPSLTTIDSQTYRKIAEHKLAAKDHQLSIRHLDTFPDGNQILGLQYFGKAQNFHPVLAYGNDQGISTIELPDITLRTMANYCGSVVVARGGKFAAAASPKGGTVLFLHQEQRKCKYHHSFKMTDVCGILPTLQDDTFLLSSGLGEVHLYNARQKTSLDLQRFPVKFDNHLS